MSLYTSTVSYLTRLFNWQKASTPKDQVKYDTRAGAYRVNQLMYDNRIYDPRADGGGLEDVLSSFFGKSTDSDSYRKFPIFGHFNPAKEIVEAYQNCLPGTWGKELRPADKVGGKDINPGLLEPLSLVAAWSNFDTEKQKLQRWAANFGTVGIRIVSQGDRVFLQVDKPDRIFDFEEDARGNVVAVVLKYTIVQNKSTSRTDPDYEDVEVVEVITKEDFSRTYNDKEQIPDDDRANTFGFCPYVILRHKDNGTPWGDWAYRGMERAIHDINWRISRQGKSIDRIQFPKWFGTAGGKKPETVDVGDSETMSYVQTEPGTPPPSLEPIVAKIDQASIQAYWQELIQMLKHRQPETNLNDVKLIAGISGEALAKVLIPTEQVILAARPAYDHATIRAMQMAVSMGQDKGLWNVGGSSGDSAYQAGLLDFEFADRPALPQSVFDKINQANADTARRTKDFADAKLAQSLGVDEQTVLETAGFDKDKIAEIRTRKATVDVVPDSDLEGRPIGQVEQ